MAKQDQSLQNEAYQSKYTFTETADGFVVRAEDRVPVRVQLHPTHFSVFADDGGPLLDWRGKAYYEETVGFYKFHYLSSLVSWGLMRDWEPPADKGDPFPGLTQWAYKQTARAIGKRLHRQWKRLLTQADPMVLAVQRAMFAATMTVGRIAYDEELYRQEYIVDDIVNYRAAAIAAVNINYLAHSHSEIRPQLGLGIRGLDPQQEHLLELVGPRGLDSSLSKVEPGERVQRLLRDIHIEQLKNWRDLFSDTGRTYRRLDRTLMNLPGGIPYSLVSKLNRWHLERPQTERLELTALLLYGECDSKHNAHIFQHAKVPEIKHAIRRVADATNNELSSRRTKDVKFMVDYLADYPGNHTGSLSSLARRSIQWHRDLDEGRIQETRAGLEADTKTAMPPRLPEIEGVTLLETVGDVVEEGRIMDHCIASYASKAVAGHSYLFHIDHNGHEAIAEVNASRCAVLQVHGPRNQRNAAVAWARHVLSQWCDEIRDLGGPQIRAEIHSAAQETFDDEEIPF